ncbi:MULTISPECIES: dihydroxyacetone kinase subunit L [Oceanotoga]|uniref:dihydroxyacetone kinase subunit L n=1 Tax=Oceanotoga TaxID=1255275 RepID=UPI00265118AC|nr:MULTISPECIES: dihydroxyacetone kinase subunit L [Oceanotoga]MDN5342688.1 phosphoenolpyruvate---glycerone phosphotransferase subunit DhaL [Oceanotoga sp.]MDO7976768.1 DAK2 domain-containing protein [Oceanotoga teriensis]
MKKEDLKSIINNIHELIKENKKYLIELDQMFGDGDLGISMEQGFEGVKKSLLDEEKDMGKVFRNMSTALNESAPSSLGTIISFGILGMAKQLKGIEEPNTNQMSEAFEKGLETIMQKARSEKGQKTILDSIIPAIETFKKLSQENKNINQITYETFKAAEKGCESTKEMMAVHGRAAYHKEKTLGVIDGGSVVGKLIFEGICKYYND